MWDSDLTSTDGRFDTSESLACLSRGFSCPEESFDAVFFEFLAVEHVRQVARTFLELYQVPLRRKGRGLAEFLGKWLEGETDFPSAWDYSWGDATTPDGAIGVAAAAAAIALRLGSCGVPGDWTLTVDVPFRPRWSYWLLQPCDEIEVHCDGQSSRVRTSLSGETAQYQFHRAPNGWQGSGSGLLELPTFGTRCERIVLLPSGALEGAALVPLRPLALPHVQPEMADALQQSLVLLHRYAPPYLPWVLRVLRHIVLLKYQGGSTQSGSSGGESGLIHMSFAPNCAFLAESMVHEASHQYLHALCKLGPLDDGSDTALYYSPVKRTGRALARIALSYHAFANILLFYRFCRRNGAPDGDYIARNEPMVADHVRQMELPLRDNPALTPIGQALCRPLMERLSQDS